MQIDQKPGEYRVKSKTEPVFAAGGLRRLALWATGLVIAILICLAVAAVIAPLEPFVRGLIC